MIEVVRTGDFDIWLRKLRDRQARLRIVARIDRLVYGNPGDVKPVGRGISEMRLTYGPGYWVYYLQDGEKLILLLCGGDKSTQSADIANAQALAEEWHADKDAERDGE